MIQKLFKDPFKKLAAIIYRRKYIFAALSLLLTTAAVLTGKNIKFNNDFASLLDPDHPAVQQLNEISGIYGGVGVILLMTRSDDAAKGKAYMEAAGKKLRRHPEIRYVDYKRPNQWLTDRALLFMDTEDLQKIYYRLYQKIDYEKEKTLVGPDLFFGQDPGLYWDDIRQKYENRFGLTISDTTKPLEFGEYYHKRETPETQKIINEVVAIEVARGRVPASLTEKYTKLHQELADQETAGQKINWTHTFVAIIKPGQASTDVGYSREIVAEVYRIAEEVRNSKASWSDIHYDITGRYKKKIDSLDTMAADSSTIAIYSGIGVLVILTLYFQSFWPIVLLFTSLIMGVLWTVGFAQVTFGQFNMVTSMLMAILVGLGVDFGIHYMVRYKEEREAGNDVQTSFMAMLGQTGLASLSSGLTTAFAFFVLTFSGFRAFSELGVLAASGVLFILAAMTLFMGPAILVLERFSLLKFRRRIIHLRIPAAVYRRPGLLAGTILAITLAAGYFTTQISFDYYFGKMVNYPNLKSLQLDAEANKMFSRSLTPQIILPEDKAHEERILDVLYKYIRENKDNPNNKIVFALGISALTPDNQPHKLALIQKTRYLLLNNQKYTKFLSAKDYRLYNRFLELTEVNQPITEASIPKAITRNLKGVGQNSHRRVVLLFTEFDSTRGEQVAEYVRQLDQIRVDNKPLNVAADVLVSAEVFRLIESDGYSLLYLVFAGVFVFVFLNFGSPLKTLIVFVPLVLGIVNMAGFMGIAGVHTDYFNVIMIPVVVGIGIDSGIHIYHRYLETGNIIESIRTSGEAVTLSTITSIVGFGALSLARNGGLASMGMVAVIGLSAVYLASVLLLPATILLLEKVKKRAN